MVDCPLAAVLTAAAARLDEPDLARLAAELTAPVRVRVTGVPEAAARALHAAGVPLCGPDEQADLEIRPVALSVPAAVAAVDPGLDDEALRALTEEFGVSKAGADRTTMRAALHRAGGVDAVRAAIDRAAAPVVYRRIEAVLAEVAGRAAGPDGARLADLLAGDDVVLARMLAAADVVRESGMPVPVVPDDPLAAAIRWRRYASGPVSDLHRACGADLARGALRLWDRRPRVLPADARPAAHRAGLQHSRIEAATGVRAACAVLRAELQAGAARATRSGDFVQQARRRVADVASAIDSDITARLVAAGAGPGHPDPPAVPGDPPLRTPGLESRLAALLGITFGAGVALTLCRMLAELAPRWSPGLAAGCAAIGLALALWVVRARRLLSERAAAERWVLEVTAGLRSAMEDQVNLRFAAAEVTLLTSGPFRGSPRR